MKSDSPNGAGGKKAEMSIGEQMGEGGSLQKVCPQGLVVLDIEGSI